MVAKRAELLGKGYAVLFYPANWGGNAHPKNRAWCVYMPGDLGADYGTLRYLERSMQEQHQKYVILRTRKK